MGTELDGMSVGISIGMVVNGAWVVKVVGALVGTADNVDKMVVSSHS